MLGNYQPPGGPDSPLIDPETQKLIDEYRQQQLIQQLAGQQEAGGRTPQNLGEGYRALGQGAIAMLQGFKARSDAERQAALMGRIASAFGGGGTGMPMPRWSAPAVPAGLAGGGGIGGASIDRTYDPLGKGTSLQPRLADYAQDTLQDAADRGVPATIISGLRSPAEQAALVARGSYAAQPGQSRHQYGAAFDVRPDNPSPAAYAVIGDAAKNLGLTWGGDFRRPDVPHIQLPGSLAEAKAGSLGSIPPTMMAGGLAGKLAGISLGESGNNPYAVGDSGSSFGKYQLHKGGIASGGNAGPGLGDDFQRDTGFDPRDPAGFPAQDAWVARHIAGKTDAEIKKEFHGYKPEVAAAASGPASYGVPPGQVAGGNAVPANLPPPIEGRSVARPSPEGPGTAMAPLTPLAEPQSPISPVPIQRGVPQPFVPGVPVGAQQGFTPGAPPAAGGPPSPAAVPMPPVRPATPSQVPAVPPAGIPRPAGGGPGGAPPGTHWAQLPGPPLLLADNQDDANAGGGRPDTGHGLLAQLFGGSAQAAPIRAPGGPALAGGLSGQPRAATGGPVPATVQPQPQQAQAAPSSGDPYFDNIVQQHSYAMNQAARYSQGAAAAFNTPLAAQFSEKAKMWDGIANKLVDEANAFILKREEQTHERPMTQEEADAHDIKDRSSYMVNDKTGEIKRIQGLESVPTHINEHDLVRDNNGNWVQPGGPSSEKDIEKVRDWEAYKKDQERLGQPALSYFDYHHQAKTGTVPEELQDRSGKPIDESVNDESLLPMLQPEIAIRAKKYLDYTEKQPTQFQMTKDPVTSQAWKAAERIGGADFNPMNYPVRQKMLMDIQSNGKIGQAVSNINQLLHHTDTLSDALKRLHNTDSPSINYAVNNGLPQLGGVPLVGNAAKDKADAVRQVQEAINAVSNESARVFRGPGPIAHQDIQEQLDHLNLNDAPQAQFGALKALQNLMSGRVKTTEEQVRNSLGDQGIAAWEHQNKRPFGFIHPDAEKAMNRVSNIYENVRTGKGFAETASESIGSRPKLKFNHETGRVE